MARLPPKLRVDAEAQLARAQPEAPALSAEKLLHELQVHQIELEMQNEELRRAQIALEESRDRYVDLYEFAPVGYLTLTRDGRIAKINLAGAALLGEDRAKLLQKRLDLFVAPEDRDRWYLRFMGAIGAVGNGPGIELRIQREDATAIDVHLDCLHVELVGGGGGELRVAMTDISAMALNKQLSAAQDDLHEQLLFQSSLLESIPIPIFYKDCEGRYLGCNRAYEDTQGKSRAEIVGKSMFDMAPREIAEMYHAMDVELFRNPGRQVYEWAIRKPSGDIRNVLFHKATFLRKDGSVGGLIGALVDITELKQKDAALEESEERLRTTTATARDAIVVLEAEGGTITAWNLAAEAIFGYTQEEALGQVLHDFLPPQRFRAAALRGLSQFAASGEGAAVGKTVELVARHKDGREFPIELSLSAMQLRGKWHATGIARDITERKRAEKSLSDSESRFRSLVETTSDWIWEVDAKAVYTYASPRVHAILGYEPAEVVGKTVFELMSAVEAERLAGVFGAIAAAREPLINLENTCLHKAGHAVVLETCGVPVFDQDGEFRGYRGIDRDITERKHYQAQLERKSNYDDLSGLPNRNLLTELLTLAVARCQREQRKLAVLVLNLDRFGEINDSLGRAVGDGILREAAERLRGLVREMDTLARSGGDEFVLVREIAEEEEVVHLAERILETLAQPFLLKDREIFLYAGVGISVLPRDGRNSESLLNNALVAMYCTKALGGNKCLFYSAEMNAHTLEHLNLESELRRAIERDELLLYYQPQASLRNGEIVGMEALVRWRHPVRGLVSPMEFIPLAEATGLIVPLGEWVLRTACAQNRAWQQAGLSAVAVAVNLSARQFEAQDIVATTRKVLSETGLDPSLLELELTESAAMGNAEAFVGMTEKLKDMAVTLSIDDFGTGYSSLSYLKRFALDRLKIDQSFVRDIVHDPDSAAIAMAVITLAHSLGLSVIAEGVETEAQLNFLRVRGCDEMQGYYFSKPLPAAEFEQLLREERKLALPDTDDPSAHTLLQVDDEPSILAALTRQLRREGYRILTATSARSGLELLATHDIAVVMSDQRMPEMSGTEFLAKVRAMYPETVRLILSGYTELRSITDVVNRGEIYKFLEKPWEEATLREILRDAFRHYEARRAVRGSAI